MAIPRFITLKELAGRLGHGTDRTASTRQWLNRLEKNHPDIIIRRLHGRVAEEDVEKAIAAIAARRAPARVREALAAAALGSTDSVSVWSSRCYIDDMRFSNSVTVEHNTLTPGVIGHILRNRSISKTSGMATDRWLHYDQVGSVMSESDASGNLDQVHHQDAFGNTQASWSTGLWGGDRAGWHHNTKEFDSEISAVNMFQRWYIPETGNFISSAPYPSSIEHRYGFAGNRPVDVVDPDGRKLRTIGPRKDQADAAINVLKSCDIITLSRIIDELEKSPYDHVVSFNNLEDESYNVPYPDPRRDKSEPGGSGSNISLRQMEELCPGSDLAPIVTLAHELGHASNRDKGSYDPSYHPGVRTTREEYSAMQIENMARSCLGLDRRMSYGKFPCD